MRLRVTLLYTVIVSLQIGGLLWLLSNSERLAKATIAGLLVLRFAELLITRRAMRSRVDEPRFGKLPSLYSRRPIL